MKKFLATVAGVLSVLTFLAIAEGGLEQKPVTEEDLKGAIGLPLKNDQILKLDKSATAADGEVVTLSVICEDAKIKDDEKKVLEGKKMCKLRIYGDLYAGKNGQLQRKLDSNVSIYIYNLSAKKAIAPVKQQKAKDFCPT